MNFEVTMTGKVAAQYTITVEAEDVETAKEKALENTPDKATLWMLDTVVEEVEALEAKEK